MCTIIPSLLDLSTPTPPLRKAFFELWKRLRKPQTEKAGGSAEGWASPSSVIPSPHPTPHPRGSGLILTSELQQGFEKQKTQKGRKEERQKAAGNSGI